MTPRCNSKLEHLAERQLETLDELAELLRVVARHLGVSKKEARAGRAVPASRIHKREAEALVCVRCQAEAAPSDGAAR